MWGLLWESCWGEGWAPLPSCRGGRDAASVSAVAEGRLRVTTDQHRAPREEFWAWTGIRDVPREFWA